MKNFTTYNDEIDELPIVVSLPHSGEVIPAELRKGMNPGVLLPNVDWFLPDLYAFLPQNGVTVLENNLHRYIADPNRYPEMVDLDGDYRHEVVYSQTTFGKEIYQKSLTADEIQQRIQKFYQPYHQQLQDLIDRKLRKFKKIYLFDLHSFAQYPHEEDLSVSDVVLGNKSDSMSSSELRQILTEQFQSKGYSVSNNHPFSGGYITQHYGKHPRVEAIQVELAYRMYIEDRYFGEEELRGVNVGIFTTAKNSLQSIFLSLLSHLN